MKILHLEDTRADAELTQLGLLESWPDCQIEVVSTRDDFLKALTAPPDLILSDFNLAGFSGLEALRIARERVPETPFVFFSGTIGEDRAIEALHHGASDYVIKDRPKRLVPAIQRAIDTARHARERKAVEEQMMRVQRLENLGMLAAGIAHDFNNVLAPVMMGIPLVRRQLGAAPILDTIERSAERGAGLVRQILGFAHGVSGGPQLMQPKPVLRELTNVIEQTFPKHIRLVDRIAGDLWPIKAKPTQLHQVLLNLCVNARDAMPSGGTITLRAENRKLDATAAAALTGAAPGPYLLLEVSDTGTGIPPEIQEKIWDPFFTTKGPDKGTGLGLATVRAIIAEHRGFITLRSKPGQGTSFEILLPAEAGASALNVERHGAEVPGGHGELILVVDDHQHVRDVTSATLTAHGYKVLMAADGTEALALIAARSLELRVLVTGIDLPNLDGAALTKVALTLNPALRIILMSGSSNEDDPRRRPPPGGRFLAKPFPGEQLLRAVHEVLSQAPGPAIATGGANAR